jgi:ABC-type glycerol-3-phosphate transport system substrate-binding protein
MSKFQTILITVFAFAAVLGVLIFSGIVPIGKSQKAIGVAGDISLWAPFENKEMTDIISEINDANKDLFKITYTQKPLDTYEEDIIDALASGAGPDIWVISHDMVLKNKDKIYTIPFESFPERFFKDSFVNSAELFIIRSEEPLGSGLVGLPIAVDPLVLYWNRDLFSSAGIARSPKYWDEFLADSEQLTERDDAGNIILSGTAMGEFRNVTNAKEILSMLLLQTGNPIIDAESLEAVLGSVAGRDAVSGLSSVESSIRFFNEFSDPKKTSYSWNRALSLSEDAFVGGTLAMHFGYASDYSRLKKKNPYLNFDVAVVPQIRSDSSQRAGEIKTTFGKIYAVIISKNSLKKQPAFSAVFKLSEAGFGQQFVEAFNLAPVRRDLLTAGTKDPIKSIFYESAVMSRSWLEPDSQFSYEIFKNMVESVATGRLRISEAIGEAEERLSQALEDI